MKEKVLEKLAEWMKPLAIPAGEYRGRSYNYILPLRPYVKGKRRDAIAESLAKYDVLTDGVRYFPNVLPVNELHSYANHLNSSQILCYNFFGKLLAINEYSERNIKITPEMRNWLERYLPTIPKLSDNAICVFEAVVNPKEGTSFDFIVYDCNTEIRFEIKFTEYGFGKTKKDSNSKSGITHHQKYTDIYQPCLNKSTVVRNTVTEDDFFCNYQLFRNVITGNRPGAYREIYNVFMYPSWNTKCAAEFENFTENYVVDKSRILNLEWDKVVPQEMKGFLDKYYL